MLTCTQFLGIDPAWVHVLASAPAAHACWRVHVAVSAPSLASAARYAPPTNQNLVTSQHSPTLLPDPWPVPNSFRRETNIKYNQVPARAAAAGRRTERPHKRQQCGGPADNPEPRPPTRRPRFRRRGAKASRVARAALGTCCADGHAMRSRASTLSRRGSTETSTPRALESVAIAPTLCATPPSASSPTPRSAHWSARPAATTRFCRRLGMFCRQQMLHHAIPSSVMRQRARAWRRPRCGSGGRVCVWACLYACVSRHMYQGMFTCCTAVCIMLPCVWYPPAFVCKVHACLSAVASTRCACEFSASKTVVAGLAVRRSSALRRRFSVLTQLSASAVNARNVRWQDVPRWGPGCGRRAGARARNRPCAGRWRQRKWPQPNASCILTAYPRCVSCQTMQAAPPPTRLQVLRMRAWPDSVLHIAFPICFNLVFPDPHKRLSIDTRVLVRRCASAQILRRKISKTKTSRVSAHTTQHRTARSVLRGNGGGKGLGCFLP
jgi:hypothetical protein